MYQAISEDSGARSGLFHYVDELEDWLFDNHNGEFWDVLKDGQLVFYWSN